MGDDAFRFHVQPQLPRILSAAAAWFATGSALVFVLGIISTLATTTSDGYAKNSTVYVVLLLVLAIIIATVSVVCVRKLTRHVDAPGALSSIGIALAASGLLMASHVGGIWTPLVAGWGGRTVRDFEQGAELDWAELIGLYFLLGGTAAFVIGFCAGLLAWLSLWLQPRRS